VQRFGQPLQRESRKRHRQHEPGQPGRKHRASLAESRKAGQPKQRRMKGRSR
jgi:hypothetical protein